MSNMSRAEAIKELKEYVEGLDMEYATPFDKAILFAIASLETDEAYQLEYESTTKDNLGVEKDLVSSIFEKISEQVTETREEFIFETIRPYCENVVQMKISKRDLEQALLKYYGKNDLGVDCISRKAVLDGFEKYSKGSFAYGCVWDYVKNLPSVTPQPRKGHWISHREHCKMNNLLPSGLGSYFWCSECDCGIDSKNFSRVNYNFCPHCGADMREVEK